jgi:outer membrane protein assembly factor BamD (BamD/ComL family)
MLIPKIGLLKITRLNVVLQNVKNCNMHIKNLLTPLLIWMVAMTPLQQVSAQGNITFDLKKPKLYENRKLPSELTPDKKINFIKKTKENVASHYNYYFNANNKIKDVVTAAKQSFKDTFSTLIPFYDFSLTNTSSQQAELDSVIIKANNGVLLHDLRSDWVDDLYFLMGQSYYYQQKFDSAYDVFQYINYNFQPREKDEIGYEKSIGSNINSKGNVFTISSKEDKGVKSLLSQRAIRNDALVWIIRSLIEMKRNDDAKSLIETLTRDYQFPIRLKDLLAEQKAYWYYKNAQYDSAAYYLEGTMSTCINNGERARKYFLIAQLYAQKGKADKAESFFEKSISLTTDPIMETYARIQQIGLGSNGKNADKKIEASIQSLLLMTKKEKYDRYKPIIFAAAAELEIKRKKPKNAIDLFVKSNEFNQDDPDLKNKNNIQIANLAFDNKNYPLAKTYYDSINTDGVINADDINLKKTLVSDLVKNLNTVQREDSLQKIANMSEKDRDAIIKDLLKKLKKEQGIVETTTKGSSVSTPRNNILDVTTGSLFPTDAKNGEWYFNNPSLKAQGTADFKNKWGNRPNSDNWRRGAALNALVKSNAPMSGSLKTDQTEDSTLQETELTEDGLKQNIPLTREALAASNERKYAAFKKLGSIYKNKLGACNESVIWNERLIAENPTNPDLEQILFDLAFCFKENGNEPKSSFYSSQLSKNFATSRFNLILKNPEAAVKAEKDKNSQTTKAYENIYDLFLSGKFDNAIAAKKLADSTFGENLWTPQLLYIEALYYIKKKDDSLAIATLNKIPALYPASPLAEKAGIIANVLNRRAEIENELSSATIVRSAEEIIEKVNDRQVSAPVVAKVIQENIPIVITKDTTTKKIAIDTVSIKAPMIEKKIGGFQFDVNEKHFVLMLFKNMDIVYINEAKRALTRYNSTNMPEKQITIRQDKIEETPFFEFSTFNNANDAIEYFEKIKKVGKTEIFPWLTAEKYSFIIISPGNFKLMMEEKKLDPYYQFLLKQLPGKF